MSRDIYGYLVIGELSWKKAAKQGVLRYRGFWTRGMTVAQYGPTIGATPGDCAIHGLFSKPSLVVTQLGARPRLFKKLTGFDLWSMGLWFWEVAIIEVLCWLFSSAKSSLRVRILMSQECLHGPSCVRGCHPTYHSIGWTTLRKPHTVFLSTSNNCGIKGNQP